MSVAWMNECAFSQRKLDRSSSPEESYSSSSSSSSLSTPAAPWSLSSTFCLFVFRFSPLDDRARFTPASTSPSSSSSSSSSSSCSSPPSSSFPTASSSYLRASRQSNTCMQHKAQQTYSSGIASSSSTAIKSSSDSARGVTRRCWP